MSKKNYMFRLEKVDYKAVNVEWEITDYFTNTSIFYQSPIFSFAKNKWMLRLMWESFGGISLQIKNETINNEPREEWKCKFSVMKASGELLHFPAAQLLFDISETNEQGVVLVFRDDVTSSSNLTIVCTLQHICFSDKYNSPRKYGPFKLIKFDALTENFKKLSADKDSCDVILRVQEKILNAHKAVLVARSPVFASMFHHNMLENQTGIVIISDCDPDSFQKFLEYLYSGELDDVPSHDVHHLYRISDKYDVQDLKSLCTEYMEKCLTEDNVCDILTLADMYGEAELFLEAQDYFNKNAHKVVKTAHWENLMKNNSFLANELIKVMQNLK